MNYKLGNVWNFFSRADCGVQCKILMVVWGGYSINENFALYVLDGSCSNLMLNGLIKKINGMNMKKVEIEGSSWTNFYERY